MKKNEGLSCNEAYNIVSAELEEIWSMGLNIYTIARKNIKSKLSGIYEGKSGSKKQKKKSVYGFRDLYNTPQNRQNDSWKERVSEFNMKMQTGFDIKTFDELRIKELTEVYGVKIKDEDEQLYKDYCKIKTCECSWSAVTKCRLCPRQMYSSDAIDRQWKKWTERKMMDAKKKEPPREVEDKEQFDIEFDDTPVTHDETEEVDPDFDGPSRRRISDTNRVLRSCADETKKSTDNTPFPLIPLRFSRKELNPKVMAAIVHIQSKYKVSDNDVQGLCVDLANMVFGQHWVKDTEGGIDDEEYYESEPESEEDTQLDSAPKKKKKKHAQKDLTYTFPCRSTRRRWLRQGALLNLRYVAHNIIKKDYSDVVTLGFDDTTKAAGVRIYDVKTTNISVKGDSGDRKTFTTGFTPNLSHSGVDQAETLQFNLQCLALLSGDDTTVDDIKDQIDFWMSDRVADTDVTLDELQSKDFKGFQSNRFGRTSFLASLYLEHQQDLLRFFDEEVDENSNKLVLALTAYFKSDWFTIGCKVYSKFDYQTAL